MTLLRVLHAEALKIRRTIAWKMVVLAPGIVVVLAFFAAWQAPFSTISRFGPGQEWAALTRFCMRLWAILNAAALHRVAECVARRPRPRGRTVAQHSRA